jgi:hypothetical protein
MKKIDLTPYYLGEQECSVTAGIVNLLFNPTLKLSARDLILQDALANKIEQAGKSVLLEDAEYQRIKTAIESFSGYRRGDLPLVERVLNSTDAEVKEV